MGYYTTLSGELRIEPPLTWSEMRESKHLDFESEDGFGVFKIQVLEQEVETEEGVLSKKSGVAIEPFEDSVKAYHARENLAEIVAAFPGHRFIGCIEGDGEEQGDTWRLYVRDGNVIEHKGVVSWPDAPLPDKISREE
jgi:hypothetical protein